MKIRQLLSEDSEDFRTIILSKLKQLSDDQKIEIFVGAINAFNSDDVSFLDNIQILKSGNHFGMSLKNISFGNHITIYIQDDIGNFEYQLDSDLCDRLLVKIEGNHPSSKIGSSKITKIPDSVYSLIPVNLKNKHFDNWDRYLTFSFIGIDLNRLDDMNVSGELSARFCTIYCDKPTIHEWSEVDFKAAVFLNKQNEYDITPLLNMRVGPHGFYNFSLALQGANYPNIIKLAASPVLNDISIDYSSTANDFNKAMAILKDNYQTAENMNPRKLFMSAMKTLVAAGLDQYASFQQ